MRKKRSVGVFLIITSLIIMLLPVPEADAAAPASAFTVKGGKLTKYQGTDKVVTIPDNVEVIGESAFSGNSTIEGVVLSKSVTAIEAYAFWGCDNLKTIQFSSGMTLISDFAFTNCGGLESVSIPDSVRYIGIQAFSYCERLEDITIPPEVIDISEDAFDGDYLLNIHCVTGSYADKYAQAFYERQKNMPVYSKPVISGPGTPQEGTVTPPPVSTGEPSTGSVIEPPAYEVPGQEIGSTKVVANQAVVLMQNARLPVQGNAAGTPDPGSVGSQGADAQGEYGMSERIPERAYYRETGLKTAEIDSEVKNIEAFAYARSGVERVSLPEGLERIGYAAFYHCDDLAEVSLPESLKTVSSKAFSHTPWVEHFLDGTDDAAGDFLISGGVLVAYRGNTEEVIVPEGVRVIAGEAFAGHTEIRNVILPDSLQEIDGEAFKGCEPESVAYHGGLLDQELVEELVIVNSQSAAPLPAKPAVDWKTIVGVLMLFAGSLLVIRKTK